MKALFALFAISMAAPAAGDPPRLTNEDALDDAGFSVNSLPLMDAEGTGVFTLEIAADGEINSCHLTDWSGSGRGNPAMEKLICAGLRQHARFVGARDPSGSLTSGPLTIAVDPKLPDEPEITNATDVFTSEEYPASALRAAQEGDVLITVDVDAVGKPTNCAIRKSSDVSALDEVTCRLATSRAQFRPAHNNAGQAIAAPWKVAVRWTLPGWHSFGDSRARTILTYNAAGTEADCVIDPAPPPSFQKDMCDSMRAMAAKHMAKDYVAGKRLVFEQGFLVGGADSVKAVGTATGQTRINVRALALTIDHDGKVTGCKSADEDGGEAAEVMCAQQKAQRYQPLGNNDADFSDRHGVVYVATYFEVPAA